MERKNVVLLTVIAVATLLTAMVGSTFAYFTAQVTNSNEEATELKATTATAKATYSDGSEINATGIAPGWKGSKVITIQNDNSDTAAALDYTISFESLTNGFYDQETGTGGHLKYTLTKTTTGGVNANENDHANIVGADGTATAMGKTSLKGTADANTNNILVTGHLEKGEKHEFTLTFELENDPENPQPDDQGAEFSGKLIAKAKAVKSAAN